MNNIKLPPRDVLYPTDITPVIHFLEDQGMTEAEVVQWFKKTYNEYYVDCQEYYKAINAGRPNPLQQPLLK